jgi:hypothetical protein
MLSSISISCFLFVCFELRVLPCGTGYQWIYNLLPQLTGFDYRCLLLYLVQLKLLKINSQKLNKILVDTFTLRFNKMLMLRAPKSSVYILGFVYNCCFDRSVPQYASSVPQYASSVPSRQALILLFIIYFGQEPIKFKFFLYSIKQWKMLKYLSQRHKIPVVSWFQMIRILCSSFTKWN